jgi:hypothetical protein
MEWILSFVAGSWGTSQPKKHSFWSWSSLSARPKSSSSETSLPLFVYTTNTPVEDIHLFLASYYFDTDTNTYRMHQPIRPNEPSLRFTVSTPDDNVLIGCVRLFPSIWYCDLFCVHPRYRNTQVAASLLRYMIQHPLVLQPIAMFMSPRTFPIPTHGCVKKYLLTLVHAEEAYVYVLPLSVPYEKVEEIRFTTPFRNVFCTTASSRRQLTTSTHVVISESEVSYLSARNYHHCFVVNRPVLFSKEYVYWYNFTPAPNTYTVSNYYSQFACF